MASLKPLMMDVGWILFLTRSLARFKISAATMTTEVVPSPTSWSCSSASSTSICGEPSRVRPKPDEQQCSLLLQLCRDIRGSSQACLGCWVLYFKQLENSRSIVGDGYITYVVDEHLHDQKLIVLSQQQCA